MSSWLINGVGASDVSARASTRVGRQHRDFNLVLEVGGCSGLQLDWLVDPCDDCKSGQLRELREWIKLVLLAGTYLVF